MISEERREINRQKILASSTELFTIQGIHATTITQIAKASHVVDKTVLNIFGTKDKLVTEVMLHLSKSFIEHTRALTENKEYLELTGLEQILFLQRDRIQTLRSAPQEWLLLNEVLNWLTRNQLGEDIIRRYMEHLQNMICVFDQALEKGLKDGSVRAGIDKDSALSLLVPTFRAVLQQFAQVKMNEKLTLYVDVEKELQLYFNTVYFVLANTK